MNQLTTPAPVYADEAPSPDNFDMEQLVHHTELPHTRLSRSFDAVIGTISAIAHWSWPLLMLVIMINVVLRYAFGEGHIELEELQWHLYSIGWLVGLSFCYVLDDHVRVDLLHERLGLKTQAVIELLGILFLLLPFALVVLWYAIPFVQYSFEMSEISMAPGGLPYRWAIKAVLVLGFALLLLAMLSRLSRVCALLFGFPRTIRISEEKARGN
ncbi:TRAP transporter small permease subunit [Marinobacterium sp. BA1]|uniref:TRAP transporter small permease subunit n=1 Tax=Marinobacterium sp. BA1 TaxID=3138931 RepID=UPI0032E69D8D